MSFCSKCGAEVTENKAFCGACGNKVEITKTTQTQAVPPIPVRKKYGNSPSSGIPIGTIRMGDRASLYW
jgi:uncharacterized membrane protein YvbJ